MIEAHRIRITARKQEIMRAIKECERQAGHWRRVQAEACTGLSKTASRRYKLTTMLYRCRKALGEFHIKKACRRCDTCIECGAKA